MIHCIGCRKQFLDRAAFNLHATGNKVGVVTTCSRCRSSEEMHQMGMKYKPGDNLWYIMGRPARSAGRSRAKTTQSSRNQSQ